MGDESAMVSKSSASSEGGGEGEEGAQGGANLTPLVAILVLFVIVGASAAIAYIALSSGPKEPEDRSTSVVSGGSGGGGSGKGSNTSTTGATSPAGSTLAQTTATLAPVGSTPPQMTSSTTSAPVGPTPAMTRTTTTSAPVGPQVPSFPPKLLICTVHLLDELNYFDLPDSACHIMLLQMIVVNNELTYKSDFSADFVLKKFASKAMNAKQTSYGIAIDTTRHAKPFLQFLQTPPGEARLKYLWDSKFLHVAFWHHPLSRDATDEPINDIIAVVEKTKQLQGSFTPTTDLSFRILGVRVLYKSDYGDDAKMKDHFNQLLAATKPDALLFDTILPDDADPQKLTATNLWEGSPLDDQPTFADTFRFMKSVTIPATVRQLLSLRPDVFQIIAAPGHKFDKNDLQTLKIGIPCQGMTSTAKITDNKPDEVTDDLQNTFAVQSDTTVYVFDTRFNMQYKICWSVVNNSFVGGWVMHGVFTSECAFMCQDDRFLVTDFVVSMRNFIRDTDTGAC